MSAPLPVAPAAPRRRRPPVLAVLPFLLFAGLATVFLVQLVSGHDPQEIPSALIGQLAPRTVLPPVEGLTRADGSAMPGLDLAGTGDGRPALVNVFGSWCGPCREEHPLLMDLSRDGRFRLVAINQKDTPAQARQFLADLGNPYAAIGADASGRASIDWGVYGVPETFLVGSDGTILWKQTGPFTPEAVRDGLYPALEKALAGAGQAAAGPKS